MKKNKENIEKEPARPAGGFDTVKFFREVRKKIAEDTKEMSFQEFKAYLNARKLKSVRN